MSSGSLALYEKAFRMQVADASDIVIAEPQAKPANVESLMVIPYMEKIKFVEVTPAVFKLLLNQKFMRLN